MHMILLSAMIMVSLVALIAGLFFSDWLAAIGYFGGAFAALAVQILQRRLVAAGPDRILMLVGEEAAAHRFGRFLQPFVTGLHRLVVLLNWPIQFMRGIFIVLHRRNKTSDVRAGAFGEWLVPAWVGPALLTFVALLLIDGREGSYPLLLVAAALVLSTFLGLLTSVFLVDIKEDILGRPGSPKLAFILVVLFNFGSAAMSRLFIARWSADSAETPLQSAYALFALSDFQTIAERHGLALSAIADDVGALANIAQVPAPLLLQALLSTLFYLGVLRLGWETFSAKREPRHYIPQGLAHAVVGRTDHAEQLLAKAGNEKLALQSLMAIRLGTGNYKGLTKSAQKLCAVIGVDFSPEEEAVVASWGALGLLTLGGDPFVAYLKHRSPDFAEPHFTTLLAILILPNLQDPVSAIDPLKTVPALQNDPFFDLYLRDREQETAAVRAGLDQLQPASASGLLLRIYLRLSSLFDDGPEDEPDPALLAALDKDLETLLADQTWSETHWRLRAGYDALAQSRVLHRRRLGRDHEMLEQLSADLRAALNRSDLWAEYMPIVTAIEKREFEAFTEANPPLAAQPGLPAAP